MTDRPSPWLSRIGWLMLVLVLCLSVHIVNRGPLLYFDTGGYIQQGKAILALLGLETLPGATIQTDTGGVTGGVTGGITGGVTGNRSGFYGFLLVGAGQMFGYSWAGLPQLAAFLACLWLLLRVVIQITGSERPLSFTMAAVVGAGCLGSLPFYVAFLMPDLLTPVLILTAAVLTMAAERMTPGARFCAVGLGILAVISHLSHLGIALILIPVAAIIRLFWARQRGWLAPVLIAAIAGGGLIERGLFRIAVETVKRETVTYQPFLTARLIDDGPGLAYLAARCPDTAEAACALYARLVGPDMARRATASRILFETGAELGSLRLLPTADQARIAAGQRQFFLDVVWDRPGAVILALARNTLRQARRNAVTMTLPDQAILSSLAQSAPELDPVIAKTRLRGGNSTIIALTRLHGVVYGVALLGVVIGVFHRRIPAAVRVLVLMLLAGILANAFVCGAVSQPADRYGARVIFLLPMAAALLLMFRIRGPDTGASTGTEYARL